MCTAVLFVARNKDVRSAPERASRPTKHTGRQREPCKHGRHVSGGRARTIHQGRVERAQAAESMRLHLSRGSRGITRDVWGLPRLRALIDCVRRNGCTLKEFATAPNRGRARFREYLRERRRSSRTVFHETTRKVSLLRQLPSGAAAARVTGERFR